MLLVLVVGMLSTTAAGASAAAWLPEVNASAAVPGATTLDVSLQDVAVDAQGNAVAVWVQAADEDGPEIVKAATRSAGGPWSSSVAISAVGEQALGLKVVVNPDGDAAVVWIGYAGGGKQIVRASTRPAGGDWSEPVALSDIEGYATDPDVAIDGQGTVTTIWSGSEGGWGYGVVKAASRPAGGDWSDPIELSDGLALSPQVAADPEGNFTAVWTLVDPDREDGTIQSKTRPAGGEWSAEAVDVSGEGGLAREPRIAVGGDGDATAVWQGRDIPDVNGYLEFVQTARRVDGTWSAPVTISKDDGLAGDADVTVDGQGNATAIWLYWGAARFVQVRSRAADGSWGDTVSLSTKSGGLEPEESDLQVAADPQGNVTAIWAAWAVPRMVVRSASRAVGGAWSTPVDVSGATAYSIWPRMAIDPQGHATVVWSGVQGGTHAVRSRVFDPVAPELRDVTVPTSGVVGQPVAMSVDPFDVWSPVAISWDFGDGSSGSGAAVEHCYSSPGERTVTITGTDAAANAASASQTISIEPDPGLEPGSDPCGGPGPGPGPDPDPDPDPRPGPGSGPNPAPGSIAPVVSSLRQSSSRWRTQGVRRGSRLPVGTTFRFQLDRPARVRLAFLRVAPGRRGQVRGAVEMAGKAGPNVYAFRGKIRGRTLERGRYRLLVTALADGMTSAAASIGFTIAR